MSYRAIRRSETPVAFETSFENDKGNYKITSKFGSKMIAFFRVAHL
ncbi:hypothetical protein LEP1GSC039_2620 [Leptospira santarosai str. 2000027870]|nr:hypothetical protein LEP1GSC039_2620 [Leptospira santarosai str. 2000027870]